MSQFKTKAFEDNAVTGAKLRLQNNEPFRARNSTNTGDINVMRVRPDNVPELTQVTQMAGVPQAPNDLATVDFVQKYVEGHRDPKDAVRVVADANIALTGGLSLVIDGISVQNGDRVALVGQTDAKQNGVYVVNGIGSAYVLTRATDMDENVEVTSGAYFSVIEGTVYSLWTFVLATQDPITLETTPLNFVGSPTAASLVAGDMLKKNGINWAVDLAPSSGMESSNPGNDNGQLRVKVSGAPLQKDKTTGINASGEVASLSNKKVPNYVIQAADVANGYLDLPDVAAEGSVDLVVKGLPPQLEATDFSVNYTGGTGSKTRITFQGDLAAAGAAAIAAGDVVEISYQTLKL
ncbi:MAG: hypothetical protein ACXVCY_04620 [Pseudobdellovibrionaceae bacterium]